MTLALVLGTFMSGWCDSQPNIIPAPLKMVKGEGNFVVKKGLTIVTADGNDFSANYLKDKLEEGRKNHHLSERGGLLQAACLSP